MDFAEDGLKLSYDKFRLITWAKPNFASENQTKI